MKSLFYRLKQNQLKYNELQILWFNVAHLICYGIFYFISLAEFAHDSSWYSCPSYITGQKSSFILQVLNYWLKEFHERLGYFTEPFELFVLRRFIRKGERVRK